MPDDPFRHAPRVVPTYGPKLAREVLDPRVPFDGLGMAPYQKLLHEDLPFATALIVLLPESCATTAPAPGICNNGGMTPFGLPCA